MFQRCIAGDLNGLAGARGSDCGVVCLRQDRRQDALDHDRQKEEHDAGDDEHPGRTAVPGHFHGSGSRLGYGYQCVACGSLEWRAFACRHDQIDRHQQKADIHNGASKRAREPPRFHLDDRIDEIRAILEHAALDKTLRCESDQHQRSTGDGQPYMPARQLPTPQPAPGDARPDVIHAPHCSQHERGEHGEMRMRDHKVGEMCEFLYPAQRFGRSLKATDQVIERRQQQELCSIAVRVMPADDLTPPSFGGAEQIGDHRPHRDDEHHAGDDRNRLVVIRDRTEQVMVRADERIEESERPETEQRKPMAVQGGFDSQRQEVIHQCQTGRRDPQSDHIMDVEPVQGGIADAGHRHVGQDDVAENQIHRRPDQRCQRIPQRDVEAFFLAQEYRRQNLAADNRQDHPAQYVERPLELSRFKSQVVTHQQRDRAGDQKDIPAPQQPPSPVFPGHAAPAQTRHEVIQQAEQRGRKSAEDDTIDMDRAQTAERQPRCLAEKVGVMEFDGDEHADQRKDRQPADGPPQPGTHQVFIDEIGSVGLWQIFRRGYIAGAHFAQSLVRHASSLP